MRRRYVLCMAFALAAAVSAAPAAAGTCGLLRLKCPPPPAPAPDPGGSESPDQPVPAAGKQFGFNSQLHRAGIATPEEELGAAKRAGATVHRMPVTWRDMQPHQSHPPLDESIAASIDLFYEAALERGITPVFIPFSAPPWASKYGECGWLDLVCKSVTDGRLALVPDWGFLDEYETFVHAVKSRWPRALIEPWNEPNHYYKHPSYRKRLDFSASPHHFAHIQCAAYRASKRVNDDPVLAAGWAFRLFVEYVDGVYASGGAECWDRVNAHAYPAGSPNLGEGTQFAQVLRDVRALKAKYGDTDPLWVTETGYSTSGDHAVDEHTQADASRRLYNRLVTMDDVEAVIFHTLRDAHTKHYTNSEHNEYGYGFLRENWSPKPVYCYFTQAAGTPISAC